MVDNILRLEGCGQLRLIAGAYVSAPSITGGSDRAEREFYNHLRLHKGLIGGLEVPFFGNELHQFGTKFLEGVLDESWTNSITCLPGTMSALALDEHFGLASKNEDGRNRAIAFHMRLRDEIRKVNDALGRQAFFAVQVASAPTTRRSEQRSSRSALLRSLETLTRLEWDGVKLCLEHCDVARPGGHFEKGFMKLQDEISVVQELKRENAIGFVVNWARSAIEGQSEEAVVQHLQSLVKARLLSGLIFSGVSSDDKYYGNWKDTHMPMSTSGIESLRFSKSILTPEAVTRALNEVIATNIDYIGVKVMLLPSEPHFSSLSVDIYTDILKIVKAEWLKKGTTKGSGSA